MVRGVVPSRSRRTFILAVSESLLDRPATGAYTLTIHAAYTIPTNRWANTTVPCTITGETFTGMVAFTRASGSVFVRSFLDDYLILLFLLAQRRLALFYKVLFRGLVNILNFRCSTSHESDSYNITNHTVLAKHVLFLSAVGSLLGLLADRIGSSQSNTAASLMLEAVGEVHRLIASLLVRSTFN